MASLSIETEPQVEAPAPLVTLALIAANCVVFAAMVVKGVPFLHRTANQVLPWGADFGPLTESGQWWRVLTACFLHFGVVHIGLNMVVLLQVGVFTERLYGRLRFAVLYLLAGIAGNIAGLYLHPFTVSAGASGAVFGVYGALLAFLLVRRGVVPAERAVPMAWSAGFFLFYNFVFSLKDLQTDLVAHVAGMLTGFAVGALVAWSLSAEGRQDMVRRSWVAAAIVLAAGAAAVAIVPRQSAASNHWFLTVTSSPSVTAGKNDRLVYTPPIASADAQAAAQRLMALGLFRTPNVTALLERGAGGTSLSLPLNGDETMPKSSDTPGGAVSQKGQTAPPQPWDNPAFLTSLRLLGPQLASALGGPPLTIRLLNRKGVEMRAIRVEGAAVTVGSHDAVTYSGKATVQEAKALGEELQAMGFFKDRGAQVHLAQGDDGTGITFYMRQADWQDPRVIAGYQAIGRRLATAVGGLPLTVHLVDNAAQASKDIVVQ